MSPSTADLEDQLDLIFHALANRTRRAQLARLAAGPAKITDLAEPFAMTLPAASKHLRVLEAAGLVRRTIDGEDARVHRCALVPETLETAEQWIEQHRAFWAQTLEALAGYFEQREPEEDP